MMDEYFCHVLFGCRTSHCNDRKKGTAEGVIKTLASARETPTVLTTASMLFIFPRQDMVSLYVQPRGVFAKPRE